MNNLELDQALNHIYTVYYSQIVGPSSAEKELYLPDLVRNDSNTKLTIVAFKSNRALDIATRKLKNLKKKFDTELLDETTLVYCTTYKARRYIQELILTKNTNRLNGGFIFLADVDKFDPNAYGIWLLYTHKLGSNTKVLTSMILLTVSPFSWLPTDPDTQIFVGTDLIQIEYGSGSPGLKSQKANFLIIGNIVPKNLASTKILKAQPGIRYPEYTNLIDLAFTKYTTQHEVYLREDIINSGTIYRGISSLEVFKKLSTRAAATKTGDIRKVLANLISVGFTDIYSTADKIYATDIREIKLLASKSPDLLSIVGGLPLEFNASCFLTNWILEIIGMQSKGAKEAALTAAGYYGTLVAVLIDFKPDYGDLSEFVGFDDLETLMNFWDSIMVVTKNQAYCLPEVSEYYLEKWCVSNKLNIAKVFQLCTKVKNTLRFVIDTNLLEKHYKIVSTDQRVKSINLIRTVVAKSYDRVQAKTCNLNLDTLPKLPWNTITPETLITPLNQFHKEVYIYMQTIKLTEQIPKPSISTSSVLNILSELDAIDLEYPVLDTSEE